jgi:hypothetical protein
MAFGVHGDGISAREGRLGTECLKNPRCAVQAGSLRRQFPRHEFGDLLSEHSTTKPAFPNCPGGKLPEHTAPKLVQEAPFALEAPCCALSQGLRAPVQRLQELKNLARRLPKKGGLAACVEPGRQQFQPARTGPGKPQYILPQPGNYFRPIGRENLCRSAWRGCSQVRNEIRNSEIDLMSDGAQNRNWRSGDGTGHDFLVELPEVFDASATTRDDNHLDIRETKPVRLAKIADGLRNFRTRSPALNPYGINEHLDARMATVQHLEKVADRGSGRRSDQANAPREARQRTLSSGVKKPLRSQLLLQGFELRLQRTLSTVLDQAHDHLILPPRFVNGDHSKGLHALPVRELQAAQSRRVTAEKYTQKLAETILQCKIMMPRGLPAVV